MMEYVLDRQLVIFDFDGTLADTFPSFANAFDEAADKYGFKRLDRERQHALRGYDARRIMAHHGIPLWKAPAIAGFMRRALGRDIAGIRLFDGVEPVLRGLAARGVTLAIVTSNSRDNVLRILGTENVALFSHVECGASLFGKLPKVRKVLAASGIAAARAILIGDEIRDAKVSAEAGVDFGAVAWGFNHIETLMAEAPRMVFRQVGELLSGTAPPLPG